MHVPFIHHSDRFADNVARNKLLRIKNLFLLEKIQGNYLLSPSMNRVDRCVTCDVSDVGNGKSLNCFNRYVRGGAHDDELRNSRKIKSVAVNRRRSVISEIGIKKKNTKGNVLFLGTNNIGDAVTGLSTKIHCIAEPSIRHLFRILSSH